MWLVFKPTTQTAHLVPLRAVDWYWSGSATNSGATNGLLGWVLESGTATNSIDPPDFETEVPPIWTRNVTNSPTWHLLGR